MTRSGFSVVMTNWKGMDLLPETLPSVLAAAAAAAASLGVPHEVVVVDDRSPDDSASFIRSDFPSVRLVEPERNVGFARAANLGFAAARHPIVAALNNDILLDPASFSRIFDPFADSHVFAVSARLLLWDRTTYLAGRRAAVWDRGHLRMVDEDAPARCDTLFATGGAAAFRREPFLALGGFDALYHPFYWEDIDLCYRAAKRGHRVLYDPEVVMFHKHRGTVSKVHDEDELRGITARNAYLFLWKNVTDPDLRREAWFRNPFAAIADAARGRPRFAAALASALPRALRARAANARERREAVVSDRDLLARLAPTAISR